MAKCRAFFRYTKCFFQRFWPMIIWLFITFVVYWRTYRNFKTQPQYYYLRTLLGCWLCISRGTAPVLTMCSILILIPVCRSLHTVLHSGLAKISSRYLAAWLTRVKSMHLVCATTLIIFSFVHTGAHIMNAIQFSRHYTVLYPEINLARFKGENPALLICTWTGYTGIGMLILLVLIAMTSTSRFRRRHFNTFYVTHHLFILYLVLLFAHPFSGILKEQSNLNQHIPGCIVPQNTTRMEEVYSERPELCKQPPRFKCIPSQSWIWVILALFLYGIELGYRKYRGGPMEAIQACQILKNGIHLRLKCPKEFIADSGQYILLQCCQISAVEWHPFTITDCPKDESQTFEMLINVRGDWTRHLQSLVNTPFIFNECKSYISRLYHTPLMFYVDGPFSSPMQSLKHTKYAVCVAAGVGITSYVATLRHLLFNKTQRPKRLHLLWLTRDPKQLMWYAKLLGDLHKKFWEENQPDRFEIKLFVTTPYKEQEVDYIFKNNCLRNRIRMGRPNWKDEFRILNLMYGRKNVSVFCCGPESLIRTLQVRCLKTNRRGYSYNFIHEGF